MDGCQAVARGALVGVDALLAAEAAQHGGGDVRRRMMHEAACPHLVFGRERRMDDEIGSYPWAIYKSNSYLHVGRHGPFLHGPEHNRRALPPAHQHPHDLPLLHARGGLRSMAMQVSASFASSLAMARMVASTGDEGPRLLAPVLFRLLLLASCRRCD